MYRDTEKDSDVQLNIQSKTALTPALIEQTFPPFTSVKNHLPSSTTDSLGHTQVGHDTDALVDSDYSGQLKTKDFHLAGRI